MLDLFKRTSVEFDRANVSLPKADCGASHFRETAPFEGITRAGETLFLRDALKTGTSQEIHKDTAKADSALLGLEMTSCKKQKT